MVLEQAGDLEAGLAGHHQVEDDDVGSVAFCGGGAGFAVEGALDRVAEAGQLFVEELVEGRVVVDQQEAGL